MRRGEDDETEGEHPDEEQTDAGVVSDRRSPIDEADAHHEHARAQRRTEHRIDPPHQGGRRARDHAVGQCLAEEGQAAQHHPGADQRRRQDDEQTRHQRAQHLVGFDARGRVVQQDPHVADDMEDGYHSQIFAVTATDLALGYNGRSAPRGRDLPHPHAAPSPR